MAFIRQIASAFDTSPVGGRAHHIPVLDGLRGCAVLMVFASHTSNMGWLPAVLGQGFGKQGIIVFFLLSGFLMSYLHADTPFTGRNLRAYALVRAARVLPLYYVWIGLSVLIPLIGLPIWHYPVIENGFAAHFYMIRAVRSLWSIPVEVQFYVVFPVLWFVVSRSARLSHGLFALTCVAIAVNLAVAIICLKVFDEHRLLPLWFHFFGLGVLLGLLYRRHGAAIRQAGQTAWLRFGAIPVLLAAMLTLPGIRIAFGIETLSHNLDPITIFGPVALFALTLSEVPVLGLLTSGAMRWIGKVSFGLYMFQLPVIETINVTLPADTLVQKGVCLGLSVALIACLAAVSHRWFEKPILNAARLQVMPARTASAVTSSR